MPSPLSPSAPLAHAEIDWRGARVRLEYAWIGDARGEPPVVFLHEGLGSVAMWRDFPRRLVTALGDRGLVYSRPGYGGSTRPGGEARGIDYLHRQAHEVLPALLDALDVRAPAWFFGHSDGATIALLFAARCPERAAGVVAVAPHLFVEDVTVAGVERARAEYEANDVRSRLARHHADPDWVFRSWNDTWRDPAFRAWNIEREVATIRGPVLAMQGVDDEYGTLEQVRAIGRLVPAARVVALEGAGHVPQRDQPERVIDETAAFIARARRDPPG